MHIGHFVTDLDGQGGIETYVTRLGTGLSARGHRITLFGRRGTPAPDRIHVADAEALYAAARDHGVDVLHLHKAVPAAPPADLVALRTVHDNGVTCPSGSRHLQRTGEPCPRRAGLPACLWGHYVDGCGSRRPAQVWGNFRRMYDNHRVLATLPTLTVSQYLRDEMAAHGLPIDGVRVVRSPAPDGPTTAPPLPMGERPRVLFVGRLVPEKGVDGLLRAVAALDPSVVLDVAGEGDHRAVLERQAAALGLQDRVTFHGWVAGPALYALYRSARVVAVPSAWHEPAGLVPLEAAAWGRPVVATQVGGLPEYAHPSFSRLVPPNDDAGLAAALHRICDDRATAARLGRAGHAYIRRHHTMAQFLDQHEVLYTSLRSASLQPAA